MVTNNTPKTMTKNKKVLWIKKAEKNQRDLNSAMKETKKDYQK